MQQAQKTSMKETALKIFNGLSGSYDAVLDYATLMQDRRWKNWAVRSIPHRQGGLMLDLGCGTGVLEESLQPHRNIVGLDLTEEMIRKAQRKKLPNLASLVISDGELLPFRDEVYDAVISCYVVKYCVPRILVSEMARVLKPCGRLILYDFARPRGPLWPLNAMYVYGGLRVFGNLAELAGGKAAYTFTRLPGIIASRPWDEGFQEALTESGLRLVERRVLSGGVAIGFVADKPERGGGGSFTRDHRTDTGSGLRL